MSPWSWRASCRRVWSDGLWGYFDVPGGSCGVDTLLAECGKILDVACNMYPLIGGNITDAVSQLGRQTPPGAPPFAALRQVVGVLRRAVPLLRALPWLAVCLPLPRAGPMSQCIVLRFEK